jgi:hypothetical protein
MYVIYHKFSFCHRHKPQNIMLMDEEHLIFYVLGVIMRLCNCFLLMTLIKYGVKCTEEGRHDKN